MTITHVLIDYENVPLGSLPALDSELYRIYVFVGPNNKKLSTDFVEVLQTFGQRARYVRIPRSGKNSLDFHLAFYLGKLVALHPTERFHIVSKDTGFDTLIEHLRADQIDAQRRPSIDAAGAAQVPAVAPPRVKPTPKTSSTPKAAAVVKTAAEKPPAPKPSAYANTSLQDLATLAWEKIGSRKLNKPGTHKKLLTTLAADFRRELDAEKLAAIVEVLQQDGHLTINGAKIVYR